MSFSQLLHYIILHLSRLGSSNFEEANASMNIAYGDSHMVGSYSQPPGTKGFSVLYPKKTDFCQHHLNLKENPEFQIRIESG